MMPNRPTRITLFCLCAAMAGMAASASTYDVWEEDFTSQALLGAVQYEHLKFNIQDSATPVENDLSTLPQLGGAWGTLPLGDRLQCGLEASFLLGFRVDKINYLYAGGSGLTVSLSTSLWTFDLAGGAYANLFLDRGKRVRLYAGGGPLMMYANYRTDRDFSDATTEDVVSTETAFGLGVYARTGIEFRIYDAGMLGMGVRGSWADIDLSNVGGSTDLSGVAAFVTFTAGL